ncbi:MAG: ACT domain-containing protein [Aggregatilineales bacterium]
MPAKSQLCFKQLPDLFGVCKLPADALFPAWLPAHDVLFIARTSDELSIMCAQKYIPSEQDASRDWYCLRVDGDLAFDEVGVVARVASPPADAGLSIFVISTHDRDYVLVAKKDLEHAFQTYRQAGFLIDAL